MSGIKAFDNISTCDTEAQSHTDFILVWVGAAIFMFSGMLPSPFWKLLRDFFFFNCLC